MRDADHVPCYGQGKENPVLDEVRGVLHCRDDHLRHSGAGACHDYGEHPRHPDNVPVWRVWRGNPVMCAD